MVTMIDVMRSKFNQYNIIIKGDFSLPSIDW